MVETQTTHSELSFDRIGIIAGNGRFPLLFAHSAKQLNLQVRVCCIFDETEKEIEDIVGKENCIWVHLGELSKLISAFKNWDVSRVVMAGKVTKTRLFQGVKMDERVKSAFASLPHQSDDALLLAVAGELKKEGIELQDSTLFLKQLLVNEGILTKNSPSESQSADIKFGFSIAKQMGSLDIGQSVVVKDRAVMAIEAIEGTDDCIRRGSKLGNGSVVVVKVAKPNQDARFDIPVVGLRTIKILVENGASTLALEAGKVLFLDREEGIKLANQNGLIIISTSCESIG